MNQLKRSHYKFHGTVLDVMCIVWRNAGKDIHLRYLHASIIPHGGDFPVSLSRTLSYPGSARDYLTGKNRSVEIVLVRKPKKKGDLYRIVMGPRALTASSGLAPWSMAGDRSSGA